VSRRLLCAIGVLAAVLVPKAWAEPDQAAEQKTVMVTSGVVTSKTDDYLVVRNDEDPQLTFTVGEGSELPRPLIAGSDVRVEYEILEDGTLHALHVMLNVRRNPKKASAVAVNADARALTEDNDTAPNPTDEKSRGQDSGLQKNQTEDELPATASYLPLILVTGLLAFAGGVILRGLRQS
jgi:hypothetical protein